MPKTRSSTPHRILIELLLRLSPAPKTKPVKRRKLRRGKTSKTKAEKAFLKKREYQRKYMATYRARKKAQKK